MYDLGSALDAQNELFAIDGNDLVPMGTHWSTGWPEDTAIHGNMMYVLNYGGVIEVVDITDPEAPQATNRTATLLQVPVRLGATTMASPDVTTGISVHEVI